jgi:sulfofructose kinase
LADVARAARVVCVGLATLDAIVGVERLPRSDERLPALDGTIAGGGVAATAAVALSRLGVPVAFAGRVGDDDAGAWIRRGLEAEGVDVSPLQTTPGRSPFTVVLVERATGARALVPVAGGIPRVAVDLALIAACRGADWIHVDHVGYDAVASLRAAGVTTRLSVDGGNHIAILHLDDVELYAPTEAELVARYPGRDLEDALAAALAEGPSIVVATRGEDGSVAAVRGPDGATRIEYAATPPSRVVSTLGAGDVFHGALLAALVEERDIADALRRANAAAAMSCTALDARSAIPSCAELDTVLEAAPSEGGRDALARR